MSTAVLVDSMGGDLSVVNAARVSFNKWHDELDSTDEKLIAYLAHHNHWSPFAHVQLSIRVKAPIFVARQLVKHQIGLSWNEVSRRYVDTPPEFYMPSTWRKRAATAKQGSSKEEVASSYAIAKAVKAHYVRCETLYQGLLDAGVAPEQARMVLPLSLMTEWVWTGSLYAFARVCKLRLDSHAQEETADIATPISSICRNIAPVSWKYLVCP